MKCQADDLHQNVDLFSKKKNEMLVDDIHEMSSLIFSEILHKYFKMSPAAIVNGALLDKSVLPLSLFIGVFRREFRRAI